MSGGHRAGMRFGGKRVSEKTIEASVDERFELCGFRSIHFSQARASKQTPGIPDRRYVHRRMQLALWFEVKAPDGEWREDQQLFAADCEATGEPYLIGGLDVALDLLQTLGCWDGRTMRPQGWRNLVTTETWETWQAQTWIRAQKVGDTSQQHWATGTLAKATA